MYYIKFLVETSPKPKLLFHVKLKLNKIFMEIIIENT